MNWVSSMFGSGGWTGRVETTLPVAGRFRLIAAMAAAVAGAGANVVVDARLMAQDTPAELTGCLDVTMGPWVVDTYAQKLEPRPSEPGDNERQRVPPRIRFAGPYDRRPTVTRIVGPDLGWSLRYEFMSGRIVGDSLWLAFSNGFSGMTAGLHRSGNGWTGTARTFNDFIPHQIHSRPVILGPADCASSPPVPEEESHPLGRVVELEGGQVITLGEPLPEGLETVVLPPYTWNWPPRLTDSPADIEPLTTPRNAVIVVGPTRGLFGTADSIQVHTDPAGLVYSVRLLYVDPGARETLEERLRSQYGAPGTASGVPDVHIYRNASTSLWLRPWPSSQAEILLSDRGR